MFKKAIIPTIIALGLFAYVLTFLKSPQSWGEIWRLTEEKGSIIFLLTIPYLLGRFWLWRGLLRELNVYTPFKPTFVSFAVGEMTKSLPMGIYLESFLLNSFGQVSSKAKTRTYVATTAILALESSLLLPVLMVLGIDRFPWLRLTLILVIVVWLATLVILWQLSHHNLNRWPHWFQRVNQTTKEFFNEGMELIRLRTLRLLLPILIYFNAYIISLYVIVQDSGFNYITFLNCVAVFAFFVATTILIPIPTEFGLVEFSGVYALISFGVPANDAAVIMIALRIIFTGAIILETAISILILRLTSVKSKRLSIF